MHICGFIGDIYYSLTDWIFKIPQLNIPCTAQVLIETTTATVESVIDAEISGNNW